MSYFPVSTNCAQCGREYYFMTGMTGMTLHTDPGCGFCSIECARARLLYLILLMGSR
jgi:hypothetical protein